MILLVLFNFYSCSKAGVTSPLHQKTAEFQISYLDNSNNIIEEKTDSIVMKLKDQAESFFMYSKKTAENEYTSYLTENENGVVISNEKSSKLFTIRKLNNITDKKDDKEIYLVFTFNNNIKINNRAGNKFRIRLN